jgi:hypothetical protein
MVRVIVAGKGIDGLNTAIALRLQGIDGCALPLKVASCSQALLSRPQARGPGRAHPCFIGTGLTTPPASARHRH